jgi:hypothetical protein
VIWFAEESPAPNPTVCVLEAERINGLSAEKPRRALQGRQVAVFGVDLEKVDMVNIVESGPRIKRGDFSVI